ncbi:MAG TPA: efflux RND transporter periplasmic adaptor subunit [Candidatus Polarisedimenticolia bacterium]|nr:efflux RND transporter periplasmic adaptor subunit [Candidatus Polarisedimenticolia bacterium]
MRKVVSVFAVLVLVSLFGGTLWFLWNKSQKKPVIYRTETAEVSDIVKKAVATGAVIPRKEVAVKPQVSGIIDSIRVEPGDRVKRGDLLAVIRVIPQTAALAASESRVNVARLKLDDSQREYERNRKLFDEGVLPETTLRSATLARDTAQEELAGALDNLAVIRKGVPTRSGQETNTLVKATMEGTVLDVPVKEGTSVIEANTFNDGTTIATLADMSELIFEGKVDESEVGKLRPGMNMVLTIGALEPAKFDAVLEHIAPKGFEENGAVQFKIKAALKVPENALIRANYSANADIVLDRRDQVVSVKESVLQFEGAETYVEVETAPQTFERRKVKTGLSDGIKIEVLEGLVRDDKVKAGTSETTDRRS